MEVPQTRSQTKRKRENDDNDRKKRLRSKSPAELMPMTRLIDMNDDCLEKILRQLDVCSLLKLACSSNHLLPAARTAYKFEFGSKMVKFEPFHSGEQFFEAKEDGASGIRIGDLKSCLQYLRCFGPCISDFSIKYTCARKREANPYNRLHQYMNVYCHDGLNHIHIEYFDFVDKFIPLKQITDGLLHEHRQLKSLQIIDGARKPMSAWLDVIKDIPSIIKIRFCNILHLVRSQQLYVLTANVKRLIAEHPSLAVLSFNNYQCIANDAIELTRELKLLKKMECNVAWSQYANFVSKLDREWNATNQNIGLWHVVELKR